MVSGLSDLKVIPGEETLVMPPENSGLSWYCFHTRPRREKKVVRSCLKQDVRCYLPLHRSVKHYGSRRYEHMVPYFSGYVFGCASRSDCYELLCTGDIANAMKVYDQEKLLHDLTEIERALQISRELRTFPYMKRGRRVRIKRGPFRGVEGVVSERRNRFRVALNIHFIERALSIEVHCEDVEPA